VRRTSGTASGWRLLRTCVLALVVAAPPVTAQTDLRRQIERIIDRPEFEDAFWGVHVVDLGTGHTVFARNERRNFMPASTLKLFTTATALDRLGPAFRYVTTLHADGTVRNGVLEGHLVVRGSGDPTIASRFTREDARSLFSAWADSLRAGGIERVTGGIVADDLIFDRQPLGHAWTWDDQPFAYAAQISGLALQENVVAVVTRAAAQAGQPAAVSWLPGDTGYVRVLNESVTISSDSALVRRFDRRRGTNEILIRSRVPVGRTDTIRVTVEQPALYFAEVLRETLASRGITVGESVRMTQSPVAYETMRRIATHVSPALAEIVNVTNTESHNLFAEHLLKTLGALATPASPGSAATGTAIVREFASAAGVETERVRLRDGSGLSYQNMISPADMTALLAHMWNHPHEGTQSAFYASLPVAGSTGTLANRMRTGPAAGNARAKTGFITAARTLAGFVRSAGGRQLAFALFANQYSVPTARVNEAQDAIVEALARSSW
jgi:serine-type D-Ala-D-Ala carboxypeptidase/endopeptidase (penicillin-binding protein 4)